MARRIILLLFLVVLQPLTLYAETRCFLGTRTGWERTREAFLEGCYKEHNMLLVIGARPTGRALEAISEWESETTYGQDIRRGARFFGNQAVESITSVPDNCVDLGTDIVHLLIDPVNEIRDINVITPARIIYKTFVNVAKMGWHGVKIAGEPLARFGAGTVALVGSPFIKPVTYTAVGFIFTGTAVYGYGSSVAGGTVMLGATGTVLCLDIATSPFTLLYELSADDESGPGKEALPDSAKPVP